MFNRTFITPAPVNVHVSPPTKPHDTADAARLYGECVAKAERAVANATVIKFGARNELTGVKIDTGRDYFRDKVMVRLLFQLNEETFDIRVEDDAREMTRVAYREVLMRMFEQAQQKMLPWKPSR